MSGPVARRVRRRRALASALRRVTAQEGPGKLQALATRIQAIATSQGTEPPPEADLPESLARLERGATLPPELAPVLAALLLPLFRQRPDPRSTER